MRCLSLLKRSGFILLNLQVPSSSVKGRRSIFARQIAAQRLKEAKAAKPSLAEALQNAEPGGQILSSDSGDRE